MLDSIKKDELNSQITRLCDLYSQGQVEMVLQEVHILLELFPNSIALYIIEGDCNAKLQKFDAAIICYKKAVNLNPNFATSHFNLAVVFQDSGELDSAIKSYETAIQLKPDYAIAYNNLGLIFRDKNKLDIAIKCFESILKINQTDSTAYNNLGVIMLKKQLYASAQENFRKAIKLNPNFFSPYYNFGVAMEETGNFNQSLEYFRKAIQISLHLMDTNISGVTFVRGKFDNPLQAYNQMGHTLYNAGDLEAAKNCFKKIIQLNPNIAEAYNNLGVISLEEKQYGLAKENFEKTIQRNPVFAGAHYNLASSLDKMGEFDKATKYYKKALEINPEVAKSHIYNVGFLKNKFINVWKPGDGGRVLLWDHYQGIGDEIRLSSIYSEVQQQCSKFIAQIDPRLIPLFERSFSKDIEYRSKYETISKEEYDKHLPLGYLNNYFRNTLKSFSKTSNGWLRVDKKKARELRNKLLHKTSRTLVGLSWRTSSVKDTISLKELAKAFPINDFKLVNLQYGDVNAEIEAIAKDHNIEVVKVPEIDIYNDIDGLAALIWACDEVISVDSLALTLAGALGKPAKALLRYIPSFIWEPELKNNKCHWYSSVTQIRQDKPFSWDSVIEKLKKHLGIED